MEKLNIPYPVIVEGKYDRLKLERVLNAEIITTDGFGIFRNDEKKALIRALAGKTKLIVLTDPDGAGGVIRSHICGMIPPERLIRLYVPRVRGKEKRKSEPSAEGVLGVEGTDTDIIRSIFEKYAVSVSENSEPKEKITVSDLYAFGLTGAADSASRRDVFGREFGLPEGMNAKAFMSALNFLITREEFLAKAERLTHCR